MSLNLLGADRIGDGGYGDMITSIVNAGVGVGKGVASMVEQKQAAEAAAAAEKDAINKATAADAAAASAQATAKVSPTSINKNAAAAAVAASERASSLLKSQGAHALRAEAAERAHAAAVAAARSERDKSKVAYREALVEAWTALMTKAHSGAVVAPSPKEAALAAPAPQAQDTWLTRKALGPVPGWGVAVGASGLAFLLADKLMFKRFVFKG